MQLRAGGVCVFLASAPTQARGLLPLDLRQLGDGEGAVAVGEDDRQLLADHLVLQTDTPQSAPRGRF